MMAWVDALQQEVDRMHLRAGDRAGGAHLRARDASLLADSAGSRGDGSLRTDSARPPREREGRERPPAGRGREISEISRGDPVGLRPRADATADAARARTAAVRSSAGGVDSSPHRPAAGPSHIALAPPADERRGRQPAGAAPSAHASAARARAPPAEGGVCGGVCGGGGDGGGGGGRGGGRGGGGGGGRQRRGDSPGAGASGTAAAGVRTHRGAAAHASAASAPAAEEEEVCIRVARGKRPLGLVLNAQNLVTAVTPG